MIAYGRQSIDADDIDAVAAVLRGDWLTTGPAVEEFERSIVDLVGHGVQAVSVTSGTAALHTAYAAAGIGPGSEVVTTPLTFVATAAAAALLGATVRFADVDPVTGNLDIAAAAAAVTSHTAAVTAVDYAGVGIDIEALRTAVGDGPVVIEDAAHSIGSLRDGRPVGSLADLTCFSFFATKNVTTAEGGAVVGRDDALVQRARAFRNHGLVRDPERQRWPDEGPWHQEVASFGLNYRLPDVLAALGTSQLRRLDRFKARRAEIFARYQSAFAGQPGLTLPAPGPHDDPMWHLYPLRVPADRRRAIFEDLRRAGIGVQVNYIPAYWHPVFADLGYRRGMCPRAEEFYRREISLPMHAALTDADVDLVIDRTLHAVAAA